jgi:hypothetical protein
MTARARLSAIILGISTITVAACVSCGGSEDVPVLAKPGMPSPDLSAPEGSDEAKIEAEEAAAENAPAAKAKAKAKSGKAGGKAGE